MVATYEVRPSDMMKVLTALIFTLNHFNDAVSSIVLIANVPMLNQGLCIIYIQNKLVVTRMSFDFNKEFSNFSYNFMTPPSKGSSTVVNITMELFKDVVDLKLDGSIKSPESETDTKFMRQLFRSSVSITKLIQGIGGNSIIGAFADLIFKKLDFKVAMPLKPGTYRLINFTYSGEFLPPITSKVYCELKFFAKVGNFKRFILAVTAKVFANLN